MNHDRTRGFTLIEVLVALFVFTMMASIIATAIHRLIIVQSSTEKAATRLAHLQMALLIIKEDITQIIDRPVHDKNGTEEKSLIGSSQSLIFTRAGVTNPLGQLQRSTLQRTHYFLSHHELIRETKEALDEAPGSKSHQHQLLHDIAYLDVQYIDAKNQPLSEWPPKAHLDAGLPKAIRLSLMFEQGGKISQIYRVAWQHGPKKSS